MDIKIESVYKFSDKRGDLVVFFKNTELPEKYKEFGQIYFVTFDGKGLVRGNHYHKNIREWFGIIDGRIKVSLRDVNSGETKELELNANNNQYTRLEIGPGIAHSFKSLTNYAALLNYTDKVWESGDVYKLELY